MTPPFDFGTCPNCKTTGDAFYPETIEVIAGAAGINLFHGDGYTASLDGHTEIYWDGSTTVGYRCGSCKAILPESHQLYLDHLLGHIRMRG